MHALLSVMYVAPYLGGSNYLGLKVIFDDKNINLLSNMVSKKIENLSLYMWCNPQNNSCNDSEKYHGLQYAYFDKSIKTSEYSKHQWYVHTCNMKNVQLKKCDKPK
jgi:hypothetical protein